MKIFKLLAITSLLGLSACSSIPDGTYFKVGAGYKFDETSIRYDDGKTNHPVSARLELGVEENDLTYGVSHHSQWFVGPPLNDDMEYGKTEVFIDVKFNLGDK